MSQNNNDIKFSINPLDINLAKIQFNILKRYKKEVSESGDFSSIVEEYISKDPLLNISLIQVICRYFTDNIRVLEIIVNNKSKTKQVSSILCKGTKDYIFEYLKSSVFVSDSKKIIYNIK